MNFACKHNFIHVTSNLYYQQRNRCVERMVKTVKSFIGKSPDLCLALLAYRSTSLPWCGLSPAQLVMGRQDPSALCLSHTRMVVLPRVPQEGQRRETEAESQPRLISSHEGSARTISELARLGPYPEQSQAW